MTQEEKEKIRTEIKKRLEDAQNSIETLREQTRPIPPSAALGRLTRMDAIQQKSMAESNLKSAKNLVQSLSKALVRLNDADFGVCAVCGKDIPSGRILAVPEAKVCVACVSSKR